MQFNVQTLKCKKRAANAIRGMIESDENFIVSIHDHGAGGTLELFVRIG